MKTIAEIRLKNLETLIAEHGTQDKVADAAGTSSVYLSQIKNKAADAKTGKLRQMGDDMARKIERGCGKEVGWMDNVHEAQNRDTPSGLYDTHQSLVDEHAQVVREDVITYFPDRKTDALTDELMELFRQLDPQSKREYLANLRGFVAGRRPHGIGNAPAVAEK